MHADTLYTGCAITGIFLLFLTSSATITVIVGIYYKKVTQRGTTQPERTYDEILPVPQTNNSNHAESIIKMYDNTAYATTHM